MRCIEKNSSFALPGGEPLGEGSKKEARNKWGSFLKKSQLPGVVAGFAHIFCAHAPYFTIVLP
jgi:hypothetical protein